MRRRCGRVRGRGKAGAKKEGWRDVPSQAGRFDRGRGELLLGHATTGAGTRRSGGWGGDGWCRELRHDGVCWVFGVHQKTATVVDRIGVDRDHSFGSAYARGVKEKQTPGQGWLAGWQAGRGHGGWAIGKGYDGMWWDRLGMMGCDGIWIWIWWDGIGWRQGQDGS